jgi:RNA polymerase sigma factor (sigma-70 family)
MLNAAMADDPDPLVPTTSTSAERRMLMAVAYRLLGSVADAEDAVQETYVRWYGISSQQREQIDSRAAWLTRVATRICLDILGSARRRRELYVGEWLPEPLPSTSPAVSLTDPAERITHDESVTMAVLVLLESVTPAERVSFVLHDVFGFPFAEISDIVDRSVPACRQLAASARRRLARTRRTLADIKSQAETVRLFKTAFEHGDIDALIEVLDPDAIAVTDGGGRVRAALRPITGGLKVARYLAGVRRCRPELRIALAGVNRGEGLVLDHGGSTVAVIALDVRDHLISRAWMVSNPDKLKSW